MNGFGYEEKCARYLSAVGFRHVEVTRQSGDQGVDLLASRHGKKYAIQCKYYQHPVGNHAVMEAYSGAKFYHCHRAVVMTNNDFTMAATDLARQTGVILWPQCKAGMGLFGWAVRYLRKAIGLGILLSLAAILWMLFAVGIRFDISSPELQLPAFLLGAVVLYVFAGRKKIGVLLSAACELWSAKLVYETMLPLPAGLLPEQAGMFPAAVGGLLVFLLICMLGMSPLPRNLKNTMN